MDMLNATFLSRFTFDKFASYALHLACLYGWLNGCVFCLHQLSDFYRHSYIARIDLR